jgi:hypothetical protein
VLDGAAVLDNETSLLWEQSPRRALLPGGGAHYHCNINGSNAQLAGPSDALRMSINYSLQPTAYGSGWTKAFMVIYNPYLTIVAPFSFFAKPNSIISRTNW